DRVLARQAERGGDVVAGARGDDAERDVGAGDGLHREVDQAVAAEGDERVGPFGDREAGAGERVGGVGADDHGQLGAAGPQPPGHGLQEAQRPAAAGGGVDEQGEMGGHAPEPIVYRAEPESSSSFLPSGSGSRSSGEASSSDRWSNSPAGRRFSRRYMKSSAPRNSRIIGVASAIMVIGSPP